MYDPIFYPDRTPAEAARLNREGAEFFESVVRRRVDPIFYPDRTRKRLSSSTAKQQISLRP
jgi:inosine/xanthosine triphosphate pyrophosphatase family protein